MNDNSPRLDTYGNWCFGAVLGWCVLLESTSLSKDYPVVFALLTVLVLFLVLPLACDLLARLCADLKKYKLMLWSLAPAVAIGKFLNILPHNPFAIGFPFALRLQALAYLKTNDSVAAEKVLRQLMAYHEHDPNVEPAAKASDMMMLSNALNHQGKSEESEAIGMKAVKIMEAEQTISPLVFAVALADLGNALKNAGKISEALSLGERAVNMVNEGQLRGNNDLKVIDSLLVNIAAIYDLAGNFERARDLIHRSLSLRMALYGNSSSAVVLGLYNSGSLSLFLCDYEKACEALEQAKGLAASQGLQHTSLWTGILTKCADSHRALKRFDESETEQLEALRLREQINSAELIETYYFLGKLYKDTENFEKSDNYFQKALKLREERSGRYPALACILEDYAELKRAMNFENEAQEMEKRALDIRNRTAATQN